MPHVLPQISWQGEAQAALRAHRHKHQPAPPLLPGIAAQITWQQPWRSVSGPNAKVVVCKTKKPKAWPHTAQPACGEPAAGTVPARTPYTALVAQALCLGNQVLG